MTPAIATATSPSRLPWRTAVLAVGGGLVYLLPGVAEYFIYDRSAIFSGEIWRLVTGHVVHYSPSHLAYNLMAFAAVGAIIELQASRRLLPLCTVSALLIGISLLGFRPDLHYFAGASGVVTAAVAYCALSGLSVSGPWRILCLVVLLLLIGKIALELFWSGSSLVGITGEFVVVPLSHAVGAVSGLLMFAWWRRRKESTGDLGSDQNNSNRVPPTAPTRPITSS